MTHVATSVALAKFDTLGYVVLPNFLPLESVAMARRGLARLVDQCAGDLRAAGRIRNTFQDSPFEERLFHLYEGCPEEAPSFWRAELHLAELFDVFFHQPLLDVVERLIGPEIRLYPNYTVRPKLPDHPQTLVLWHQDGGYTEHWHKAADGDVSELGMINAWTPLVPATVQNGCLQFIPGSHRLGLLPHEQREHYLEIARETLDKIEGEAVALELNPGDVVLFHNLLCHRGLPNQSSTIRWSADWRYQRADQPTLRVEQGHLARSQQFPHQVIRNSAAWAAESFR